MPFALAGSKPIQGCGAACCAVRPLPNIASDNCAGCGSTGLGPYVQARIEFERPIEVLRMVDGRLQVGVPTDVTCTGGTMLRGVGWVGGWGGGGGVQWYSGRHTPTPAGAPVHASPQTLFPSAVSEH
jgi:hypothetical protein